MFSRILVTNFWGKLHAFWSTDWVSAWQKEIFSQDFKGFETSINLITLSTNVHVTWQKALFSLKPLKLSHDQRQLTLQFFWMPNYERSHTIDILHTPNLFKGLNSADSYKPSNFQTRDLIRSEDIIVMETDNPNSRPLPSIHLSDSYTVSSTPSHKYERCCRRTRGFILRRRRQW